MLRGLLGVALFLAACGFGGGCGPSKDAQIPTANVPPPVGKSVEMGTPMPKKS